MNTSPSIEKLSFGWPLKPLVVPWLHNVHAPTCAAVDTAGSGAGGKRSRCQAKADSRTAAGRGTAPSVRWGLAEGVEHGRYAWRNALPLAAAGKRLSVPSGCGRVARFRRPSRHGRRTPTSAGRPLPHGFNDGIVPHGDAVGQVGNERPVA